MGVQEYGDTHVYVDGVFLNRVSNTPEEMARSLNLMLERVEPFEWFGGLARKAFLCTPA